MLAINLITWWYTAGLTHRIRSIARRLSRTADTFSIGQLLRTLFAPFKQIDAGASGQGPTEMLQAFLGRLLSRVIGFFVRTLMIIVGIVALVFWLIFGIVAVALHLAIPLALPAGIVLLVTGWLPPPLPELEVILW